MKYRINENGCWIFLGPIGSDGYGKVKYKNLTIRAHRLMAHICIKSIMSETDVVGHRCDTPACINPEHLFITTSAGNTADRELKKRGAKGEKSPMAKLNTAQVIEIRSRYSSGQTLSQISPDYGVTDGCVQAIVKRRTWKHL